MKSPQTRQNAPANPAGKPPLDRIPRRRNPDPWPGIQRHQLMIDPIRKPIQQTPPPRHHHIAQQMRPDIHIHLPQTALNQRRQGLPRRRRRVPQRHLRVEQPLRGPVPLRAEELVVAVGELEGAAGLGGGDGLVGAAVRGVRGQAPGARPHLDDGFFEFGEDALFLQAAEGGVRGGGRGEVPVGGAGGGVGVDGGFG